jgi:tetratricopeptide (TPR) repeat protein
MKVHAFCLLVVLVSASYAGVAPAGEPAGGASPTYQGDAEAGRGLERQGMAAYQEGRYVEAAGLYERAWQAYQDPRYRYNVGQCFRAARRWEDAVTAYQERLELEPAPSTFIYVHIGRCLLELGRRDEANQAFQRYLELDPNGDDAPQVRQAIETGRWPEDAERRPAQAVEAAQQVHERAGQLVEQGQYQQAAEAYMEGYRQHNQMHELLLNAALCYLWAGQNEQATETLNQYLGTPGAEPEAHVHLADCLMTQGLLPEALQEYERYLELDPGGNLAEQTRRTVGWMRRLNPLPAQANLAEAKRLWLRGTEHARAGRVSPALQDFRSVYEIIPDPTVRYNIGECLRGQHQWEEALACYEDYLERMGDEGDRASVHLMVADCLIGLNRTDDAMEHLDAFRERAEAGDLPHEQENREWAAELELRCKSD